MSSFPQSYTDALQKTQQNTFFLLKQIILCLCSKPGVFSIMILTVSAMLLSHCDTYRFCHFSFSILIDSDEEPLVPIEAEDSESDVCSYLFPVNMTPGRPYNNCSFIVAVACSY